MISLCVKLSPFMFNAGRLRTLGRRALKNSTVLDSISKSSVIFASEIYQSYCA